MNYEKVQIPQPPNTSARDYQKCWVSVPNVGFDYRKIGQPELMSAYIDKETGLITVDVAKFEKWIEFTIIKPHPF